MSSQMQELRNKIKKFDSEMGLNYFCQRYYDPEIGRFMELDPQDSPALSPYAYCANNPLIATDYSTSQVDMGNIETIGTLDKITSEGECQKKGNISAVPFFKALAALSQSNPYTSAIYAVWLDGAVSSRLWTRFA